MPKVPAMTAVRSACGAADSSVWMARRTCTALATGFGATCDRVPPQASIVREVADTYGESRVPADGRVDKSLVESGCDAVVPPHNEKVAVALLAYRAGPPSTVRSASRCATHVRRLIRDGLEAWRPPEGPGERTDLAPLCVKEVLVSRLGQDAPVLAGVKQSALDAGCGSALLSGRGDEGEEWAVWVGVWSLVAGPGSDLSEEPAWGCEPVTLESVDVPWCPPGPVLVCASASWNICL